MTTGFRSTRALVLLVVGVLAGLVLSTGPAFAHASQVGSSPAADEVLMAAPSEVRIDFDSGLLEMGAALVVRDTAKESITVGPAVVGDRILTVPVDTEAGPGAYSVAYRVVSADGHTIEGSFEYVVMGEPEPADTQASATPSPAETESALPSAEPSGTPMPTETGAAVEAATDGAPEEGSLLPILLFGGVGLVLMVGIGGALLLRR